MPLAGIFGHVFRELRYAMMGFYYLSELLGRELSSLPVLLLSYTQVFKFIYYHQCEFTDSVQMVENPFRISSM